MGSYAFGTRCGYTINMCPEVDDKREKTGRILVNHYSFFQTPKFVDVWESGEDCIMYQETKVVIDEEGNTITVRVV